MDVRCALRSALRCAARATLIAGNGSAEFKSARPPPSSCYTTFLGAFRLFASLTRAPSTSRSSLLGLGPLGGGGWRLQATRYRLQACKARLLLRSCNRSKRKSCSNADRSKSKCFSYFAYWQKSQLDFGVMGWGSGLGVCCVLLRPLLSTIAFSL